MLQGESNHLCGSKRSFSRLLVISLKQHDAQYRGRKWIFCEELLGEKKSTCTKLRISICLKSVFTLCQKSSAWYFFFLLINSPGVYKRWILRKLSAGSLQKHIPVDTSGQLGCNQQLLQKRENKPSPEPYALKWAEMYFRSAKMKVMEYQHVQTHIPGWWVAQARQLYWSLQN